MKEILISPPNEKQKLFFESTKRYIGYGGARGGGKSWALRTKFVLLAFSYPGLRLLLLRKTLPELRENHLLPLLAQLNGIAKYKREERSFIFPNGSRIRLGYCDSENDIYQYQGQEYEVIGVEECTHFTFQQIQFLTTCNRTTRKDFKPRMYFTGNPGGVGHNWFKRLFVKGRYEGAEDPDDYIFIPATIDDNTVLMRTNPEYIKVLDSLPEKLRQAHRFGNWDIFDGQFFEEFRDVPDHYEDGAYTHVIEPFEIPSDWAIYRSFDFGYATLSGSDYSDYSDMNVTVRGKNLFGFEGRNVEAFENTNLTNRNFTGNGIYVGVTGNNYYNPVSVNYKYDSENDKINVDCLTAWYGVGIDVSVKAGEIYYVSGESEASTGRVLCSFYTAEGEYISFVQGNYFKFVVPDTAAWMLCILSSSKAANDVVFKNVQIEKGTVPTEFCKYVHPLKLTADSSGNVDGVESIYPMTVIEADNSEVHISAEYNRDVNVAFNELRDAIIALGGVL